LETSLERFVASLETVNSPERTVTLFAWLKNTYKEVRYINIIKSLNRQDLNQKIIGPEAFTSVNCAFILRKNLTFCAEAS
jgi:hypothetical protein